MTEGRSPAEEHRPADAPGSDGTSASPRPEGCTALISPYGGRLVDLRPSPDERAELEERAPQLPSIQLSERSLCDLSLLATGAFSPLDRFLGEEDHRRVLEEMRLSSGHLFPIPITLPVEPGGVTTHDGSTHGGSTHGGTTHGGTTDGAIALGREIALRDAQNHLLAVMRIEEVYERDLEEEARAVYGTTDPRHPLVAEMHRWGRFNVSGPMKLLRLPVRHDFRELRLTPAQTREALERYGRGDVVAFQTRNPMHRVHEELTRRAAEEVGGVLLLHPVVGMTQPGDVDLFTRVRTYKALVRNRYPRDRVLLALLPLAMRMAGPREALWHALIRRNFGANHLIVGRDHASPGVDSHGRPFYPPYAAQELVDRHAEELGVGLVPFREMVYVPAEDRYEEVSRVPEASETLSLSGTRVRRDYLARGRRLPAWFSRPEVAEILLDAYPPRHRQGFCLWLTGLSGSGKSTTAEVITRLLEERGRQVTVLDGDVIRTHLSRGLGFSKEDRDTNVRRIGFVAAEVVRHGGAVVCAAVSPYRATRNEVRAMVGDDHFVEIFVDTPLEVCEERDPKGMYARARAGEIRGFTGIDDPYEPPEDAEISLDTVGTGPVANARRVLRHLVGEGFVIEEDALPAAGEAVAGPRTVPAARREEVA